MNGIRKHTLATRLVRLLHGLDDADGNRLPHVTDGETTKRGVLVVRLHAHRLARDKLGNASIARLDELRARLDRLTRPAVDLLDKLSELAGNVRGVAIEHGGVTGTDLTGVVENDDLSSEGCGLLGRVVLRVGSNVSTADILHGHVPVRIYGEYECTAEQDLPGRT